MSRSLIRKNQLHPDIADLVGQYGSGFFVTSGDLANYQFTVELNGANVLYTTGDQTISGTKNFIFRPTVNGTGILLSGEIDDEEYISLEKVYHHTFSGGSSLLFEAPYEKNTYVNLTFDTTSSCFVDLPDPESGILNGNRIILDVKTIIQQPERLTIRHKPFDGSGNYLSYVNIYNLAIPNLNDALEFWFQSPEWTLKASTIENNLEDKIAQLDLNSIVRTTGNQTISGIKDFATRLAVNGTGVLLSGEAAQLPDTIVYTTGDQTISGNKTFSAQRYVFSGANVVFVDNTGIVSGSWEFNSRPTVNGTGVLLSGETAQSQLPDTIVYTTGNQTISGNKIFINDRSWETGLLPSFNNYFIPYSGGNFDSKPQVQVTVEVTGNNIYLFNIQNRSISGFNINFSNPILESGVILNVRAKL